MQKSQYANAVPGMIADMEREREEQGDQRPPAQEDGVPEFVLHRYYVEGGGVVLSSVPLEEDAPPSGVDGEPETGHRSRPYRQPPYLLYYLLMLLLFVGLDSVDSVFAQFAPTATVTIQPVTQTISTTTTIPLGEVQGRVLPALTIAQSLTVPAMGKGHQNPSWASGNLVFYNGSFAAQTIRAGTVYTGIDAVQVATLQTVTIPAANPPYVGQATILARAIRRGANGNIQAGDINVTTSTLQVRNSQFSGGMDARDFPYVTTGDIQHAVSALNPSLLRSEQGALSGQLRPGENLTTPTCTPHVISNHQSGDEAASVEVTVTEICSALAYNRQELESRGIGILVSTRPAAWLTHFQRVGEIHLAVVSQAISGEQASLTVRLFGTWLYQLNTQAITASIAGQPRLDALHFIARLPGVQTVSISGVQENQALPTDAAHIRIIVFFPVLPPIHM